MAGIGILANDTVSDNYAYKVLVPPGFITDSIIDLSGVAIIDDDISTLDNTYSAFKIQNLHNMQAQAIANLATASTQIHQDDTTVLTTTSQVLSFTNNVPTTNPNVISVNDTNDTITFHSNASYNFSSSITFDSSTNAERLITFELINTADSSVIGSEVIIMNTRANDTEVASVITLLTIGKPGFPSAPVTIQIRARASGSGYSIPLFSSILASSSSYDLITEASGISFVPSAGLVATNVQDAIEEVQSNLILSGASITSFLDAFNKAKTNADSIINNYTSGSLTSQSIVEDLITIYTVVFSYSSGILISKTISKTSGGSVTLEYIYASGNLAQINQIGGD